MRIFKDLDLVEHLGSGIPRILESYGKRCFKFTDNFLRMTFPINKAKEEIGGQIISQLIDIYGLTARQNEVLNLIIENPKISRKEIANKLGINESAVQGHLDSLKEKKVIKRENGSRGYWKIRKAK